MKSKGDHDEKGSLTKSFNWSSIVVPLAVSAVTFFVLGYVDNALFDPFMFDPIHVSTNPNVSAYKAWSMDNFSWMHDAWGFGEEGTGLLSMWPFSDWLAPYMPESSVDMAMNMTNGASSGAAGLGGTEAVLDNISEMGAPADVAPAVSPSDVSLDDFMNG
ncbi:MAG: hypothetical protein ACRBDI_08980 [Alphaproteobacteria bacterium]